MKKVSINPAVQEKVRLKQIKSFLYNFKVVSFTNIYLLHVAITE
jgi:hypothetical protein